MTRTAPTAIAHCSSLIVAKYDGTCACGAAVNVGAQIAYSKSYYHPIIGCVACDFGTFPGLGVSEINKIYDRALTAAYTNRRRSPGLARRWDARAQLCVDVMERMYKAQCMESLRDDVAEMPRRGKR